MDKYNSKIAAWLGRRNGNPLWAITFSSNCTLYSCDIGEVNERWRRHEDFHKFQIRRDGWLKFMVKYIWWNITKGYQENPYEVEARNGE